MEKTIKNLIQFLQENEKILWKRSKSRNLLSFISFAFYVAIFMNLILALFVIIIILYIKSIFILIGFIISIIIVNGYYFIWIVIKNYKKIKRRLELSPKELKEYEEFEVITNKRYIRKKYFLNFDKDFLEYSKNSLEQIGDIVFLNLDLVKEVWWSRYLKKIFFLLDINDGDTNFYIDFADDDELDEIMKVLKDILKEIPMLNK